MMRSRQVAAVSVKLVTVFVFLLLIWGIYWGCRLYGSEPPPAQIFKLHCTECQKIHEFPPLEGARGRPRKNGKVLCPVCSTYSATWGPPREMGDAVAP